MRRKHCKVPPFLVAALPGIFPLFPSFALFGEALPFLGELDPRLPCLVIFRAGGHGEALACPLAVFLRGRFGQKLVCKYRGLKTEPAHATCARGGGSAPAFQASSYKKNFGLESAQAAQTIDWEGCLRGLA